MTNQSDVVSMRRSARAILTTVIALLLVITIFATTVFAATGNQYEVKIIDNGKEITVTTNETEPIEILNQANFALAANDKLDISGFEQGMGGTIIINRLNVINVEFGNIINTYSVYSSTVGDALAEIGIPVGESDQINYSLDALVESGMVITVMPAISVTLDVDGAVANYAVLDGTVADLLAFAGVSLGADDYTEPSLDTQLSADMYVKVFRVFYQQETRTESIPYTTTKVEDTSLSAGEKVVVTAGVNGSAQVTYKVMYVNGVVAQQQKINTVVTQQPVNEVINYNSAVASNGVTSKNGYYVGQQISGRYTHYCACSRCCGKSDGVTASGIKVYNGMADPHYVACNWLPLGSVISVNGQYYTVVDRGGSGLSRSGRIDIFAGNHQTALNKGTGSCTIEIVRIGW